MKKTKPLAVLAWLILIVSGCNSYKAPLKFHNEDPFKNYMFESTFYDYNADNNGVFESEKGSRIAFAKGSLLYPDGSEVKGQVAIELAEAFELDDMLLSNLTTNSERGLLSTSEMLYINVTQDSVPLRPNPKKPPYIEIPTEKLDKNMRLYEGERNAQGEMLWKNPKPFSNILLTYDFDVLDFLPNGFYKNYLSVLPFDEFDTDHIDAAYSCYYKLPQLEKLYHNTQIDSIVNVRETTRISPLSIKAIRQERFSNSFIATKEFEKRLQFIFKTCDSKILELYIDNLDKDLSIVDEMVLNYLHTTDASFDAFLEFSKENHGNTKNPPASAIVLRDFYQKKIRQITTQADQWVKKERKKERKHEFKMAKVYKKQAFMEEKRFAFRMNKYYKPVYGFEVDKFGYKNIDKYVEDLAKFSIEVNLKNCGNKDLVAVYVVDKSIRSIFRLLPDPANEKRFNKGTNTDPYLLLPKGGNAEVIAIAYRGNQAFFAKNYFQQKKEVKLEMMLIPKSKTELMSALNFNKGYKKENRIRKDLRLLKRIKYDQKRKSQIRKNQVKLRTLIHSITPCMSYELGEQLFNKLCESCHSVTMTSDQTGPALNGVTNRWSDFHELDLYDFIRNSQVQIANGQPRALKLWVEWYPTVMDSFPYLTDNEIASILMFIDD